MKNLFEEQGIDCIIKNEFAGGAVGDLAAFETWPELWITQEHQLDNAEKILQQVLQQTGDGQDWTCKSCGENNEKQFKVCWKCCSPKLN